MVFKCDATLSRRCRLLIKAASTNSICMRRSTSETHLTKTNNAHFLFIFLCIRL